MAAHLGIPILAPHVPKTETATIPSPIPVEMTQQLAILPAVPLEMTQPPRQPNPTAAMCEHHIPCPINNNDGTAQAEVQAIDMPRQEKPPRATRRRDRTTWERALSYVALNWCHPRVSDAWEKCVEDTFENHVFMRCLVMLFCNLTFCLPVALFALWACIGKSCWKAHERRERRRNEATEATVEALPMVPLPVPVAPAALPLPNVPPRVLPPPNVPPGVLEEGRRLREVNYPVWLVGEPPLVSRYKWPTENSSGFGSIKDKKRAEQQQQQQPQGESQQVAATAPAALAEPEGSNNQTADVELNSDQQHQQVPPITDEESNDELAEAETSF